MPWLSLFVTPVRRRRHTWSPSSRPRDRRQALTSRITANSEIWKRVWTTRTILHDFASASVSTDPESFRTASLMDRACCNARSVRRGRAPLHQRGHSKSDMQQEGQVPNKHRIRAVPIPMPECALVRRCEAIRDHSSHTIWRAVSRLGS